MLNGIRNFVQRASTIVAMAAFAAAVTLFAAPSLIYGQQLLSGDIDDAAYFEKAAPFSGSWNYRGNWFKEVHTFSVYTQRSNSSGNPLQM
jgi:hypothetical protein